MFNYTEEFSVIVDNLYKNKCAFFIGSGMSREAGIPSAPDLVKILKSKLADVKSNGLEAVSQAYEEKFKRASLREIVRNSIVETKPDTSVFDKIYTLPIKPRDIITTNWDHLIEQALGQENYVKIGSNPNSVSNQSNVKINLYKIHGDIDDEIVITSNDYHNYKEKYKHISLTLPGIFLGKSIVFIGYSLKDQDFLETYFEISNISSVTHELPWYCVTNSTNETELGNVEKMGIKIIKMNAGEFLDRLRGPGARDSSPSQNKNVSRVFGSDPDDYNPFGYIRMENLPSPEWLNHTFVKSDHFKSIVLPGNAVIEGHRGSGKSAILLYLDIKYAISRGEFQSNKFVGFYLKLQNSLVEDINKNGMGSNEWSRFFSHYFGLIVAESVLKKIKEVMDSLDSFNKAEFILRFYNRYLKSLENLFKEPKTLDELIDILVAERNIVANLEVKKRMERAFLAPRFIYDLFELVSSTCGSLAKKNFYLLLDEYDRLNADQMKVLNRYLADRGTAGESNVSIKIAVQTFKMIYETTSGTMIEEVDDFSYFQIAGYMDTTNKVGAPYNILIEQIAKKRLEFYGYDPSLDQLFPSDGKGYQKGDYSGFKNITILSSGLIRDFLELARLMVLSANPQISAEKPLKLQPVPPYLQNEIISLQGKFLYTNTIDKITGSVQGVQKRDLVRTLISSFGQVFRVILKATQNKSEVRTVSSFALEESQNTLGEKADSALRECRESGVLQVPFTTTAPHDFARYAPHRKYEFHRLLCPVFDLSLGIRWPREIKREMLDKLFDNPKDFVSQLTAYFIKDYYIEGVKDKLRKELGDTLYEIRALYSNAQSNQTIDIIRGQMRIDVTVVNGESKKALKGLIKILSLLHIEKVKIPQYERNVRGMLEQLEDNFEKVVNLVNDYATQNGDLSDLKDKEIGELNMVILDWIIKEEDS